MHLTLAMEAGYQTGEKPITATLVEPVRSRQLDDLEPVLTRHGYRLKDMVEQFDAKPAEIRVLFNSSR
ncbi:phosphoribulokinase [Salmonella enterica subsp. enterica serovar Javiana]|nr:phosphoribulokinase [Salmonella enterica subsp. enterica serovar Javiana]